MIESEETMRNVKFYELTKDVRNPEPDRRSKDWHKLPVIKAGTRFVHRENVYRGERPYYTISMADRYGYIADRDALAALMLDNAREVPPMTWKELAILHDCDYGGAEYILKSLLKLGLIDGDDFAAVAAMPEEDEAA